MPKALVALGAGEAAAPVVEHALRGALRCAALGHVVVVAPPDPHGMRQLAAAVRAALPGSGPVSVTVVPGGARRSDSVAAGLAALPPEVGLVLVHDAARALTPVEVFDRVVHALRAGHPAVTPGIPVVDTVKQVHVRPDGQELVAGTVERSSLRAVQTPQGFRRQSLEQAHAAIRHPVTDDAGMVESLGEPVLVVPGDPRAMKITTPHDLQVAGAWVEEPGVAAHRSVSRSSS